MNYMFDRIINFNIVLHLLQQYIERPYLGATGPMKYFDRYCDLSSPHLSPKDSHIYRLPYT